MSDTATARVHLSATEARTLAEGALQGTGYDTQEAGILADHMLDAALCGYEYSGLPKVLNIIEHPKAQQPRTAMTLVHETGMSTLSNHSKTKKSW